MPLLWRTGSAVPEGRQVGPNLFQPFEVEVRHREPLTLAHRCEDLAPGIDDHRVTPEAKSGLGLSELIGSKDEALILNRPRPDQHLPMVPTRGLGERRRDREDLDSAIDQMPEQLGKPEVVTDGEAYLDRACTEGGRLGPRCLVIGLAVGVPSDIDVEHMDLGVGSQRLAVRTKHH
jgi:hypothetical protein